jgi:hypothetical protein
MSDELTLQHTRVITFTVQDVGPDGKPVGNPVTLTKKMNVENLQDILTYHGEMGLKGIATMGTEEFFLDNLKKPFGKLKE